MSRRRTRPAARPAPGSRPAAPRPRTRTGAVPLERGRSRGVLAGLFLFVGGFAAGAVEFLVTSRTGLLWWSGITIGLFGVGITGFFLSRGTVPRPEDAIWRPAGLRPWAAGAGLPEVPVLAAFYALLATSVVGNFVTPLFFRR